MIKTINLTKRFGHVIAVDNLNLELRMGESFGLLGPNAAGKTTTLKMIAGILKPTSGNVIINGFDLSNEPIKAKSIMGFIQDKPYIYEKLTGREFLEFVADIYEVDKNERDNRIKELLELFELADWGDELVESYSHGMRQRLIMSSVLVHRPKLLIVDEPMVGLDPKGINLVKDIFRQMRNDGMTILMSTHTMNIAEEVCDRIGIINGGRIIAIGTIDELYKLSGSTAERLESIFFKLTEETEVQN